SLTCPENSNMHETGELPVADQVVASTDVNEDHAASEQQHPKILDTIEGEPAVEDDIATEDKEHGEPSGGALDHGEQQSVSEENMEKEDIAHHEASGHFENHVEENGPSEGDESEGAAPSPEERLSNETHPDGETDTRTSLEEWHEDGHSREDSTPEHKGSDIPQHNEDKSGRTENSDEQVELENTADDHTSQETATVKPDVEAQVAQGATEVIEGEEHQAPQSDILTAEAPSELENNGIEVQESNTEPPVPQELMEQDSNRSFVEQVSEKAEAVDNIDTPQQDE